MSLNFYEVDSKHIVDISVSDFLSKCLLLPKGYEYRGQGDTSWDLVPSAFRDGSGKTISHVERSKRLRYFTDENQFDVDFKRLSALAGPDEQMVVPDKSGYRTLLMLAFFQHFGLPTPLLDWTSSPLVALFMSLFERPPTAKDVSIYRLDPSLLPTEVTFQQYDKLVSFRRIQQQVGGVLFFGSCKDSRIDIDPTIYSEYAQNTAHRRFIQKLNISIGPGDIEKIQGALKNNGFREDMIFPNSMQYVSKQVREKILQYGV